MANLRLRKLADSSEPRVRLTHPVSGEAALYTEEDAAQIMAALSGIFAEVSPTPRPFAGLQIEEVLDEVTLSEGLVAQGRAEGWITTDPETDANREIRTSGPKDNPWGSPPHVFLHYDRITFHTVDGDVVYAVVENPDKWPEQKDGDAGFGGEVRWFYRCELLSAPQTGAGESTE